MSLAVDGEALLSYDDDLPLRGKGHRFFGFSGWEPSRCTLKSKRERNRQVTDMDGKRFNTSVYKCEIVTTDETFKTRSCLDAEGVSVRIIVNATIGSMRVILE